MLENKVYLGTVETVHYRLYVPSNLNNVVIQAYHDSPVSGHLGVFKTYSHLREFVYRPGMWKLVKKFTQECSNCINQMLVALLENRPTDPTDHGS